MPALKTLPKLGTWRLKAACTEHDSQLWFPEHNETTDPLALMICEDCPVLAECRTYALSHDTDGVWGGMSPTDLLRARRREKWGRVTLSPQKPDGTWDANLTCAHCGHTASLPVHGMADGRAPSIRLIARQAHTRSWNATFTEQGRAEFQCQSCQ